MTGIAAGDRGGPSGGDYRGRRWGLAVPLAVLGTMLVVHGLMRSAAKPQGPPGDLLIAATAPPDSLPSPSPPPPSAEPLPSPAPAPTPADATTAPPSDSTTPNSASRLHGPGVGSQGGSGAAAGAGDTRSADAAPPGRQASEPPPAARAQPSAEAPLPPPPAEAQQPTPSVRPLAPPTSPPTSSSSSSSDADHAAPASGVRRPVFLQRPRFSDYAPYLNQAPTPGQLYWAQVACRTTVDGRLQACRALGEIPEGSGFGGAIVRMSGKFRIAPSDSLGNPVGGRTLKFSIQMGGQDGAP